MFPIGKKETILLDFIGSLGELEWLHYQSRIQDEWVNDHFEKVDRSKYPPYTSFRFKEENPEVVVLLEEAINSYKGEIQWSMISQKKEYGSGVNRCILPKYIEELGKEMDSGTRKINEYIESHHPDFAPTAYDDLVGLADHMRSVFKNAGYDV